jgi:hypothetical protein
VIVFPCEKCLSLYNERTSKVPPSRSSRYCMAPCRLLARGYTECSKSHVAYFCSLHFASSESLGAHIIKIKPLEFMWKVRTRMISTNKFLNRLFFTNALLLKHFEVSSARAPRGALTGNYGQNTDRDLSCTQKENYKK